MSEYTAELRTLTPKLLYAVDMVYADTAFVVDWPERERSRLFMLDFAHYVNAHCKEFN